MLFTAVFSILGSALKGLLGLNVFWTAFLFFFALGEGLGVFDLIIIDLFGGGSQSEYVFRFYRKKRSTKTPASTSTLLCAEYLCLPAPPCL